MLKFLLRFRPAPLKIRPMFPTLRLSKARLALIVLFCSIEKQNKSHKALCAGAREDLAAPIESARGRCDESLASVGHYGRGESLRDGA